jgi:tRNA threonylcarbamoyladenosine biosynthesis protein TsaB
MNFHLLALETPSSVCGVALLSIVDGQTRVRTAAHDATGEHAERLLPMVEQLLHEAGIARDQLSVIAFGQGPGGFTGLRVACGVAQGMAFALDLPVIPVVSLLAAATLEVGADDDVRVVAQDARMGEVYVAAYGKSSVDVQSPAAWKVLHDPVLMNANDVSHWIGLQASGWAGGAGQRLSVAVMGDALEAYPQLALLGNAGSTAQENVCPTLRLGAPLRATAEAVARLGLEAWRRGEAVPADQARPLYVRDKVAYTTAEREQGLGGNPKADAVVAIIEPLTQAYLDDVVAIEQSVQAFPWTKGNFADALEAGYGAWVARNGGKTVGFCVVMFAPDVAHLLLIATAPDEQRKGVGKLLLRQVERESLARNLTTVILEVRPSNQKALAFYGHRGFKQLSVRKGYYPNGKNEREDGWVLEKQIGKAGADRHD